MTGERFNPSDLLNNDFIHWFKSLNQRDVDRVLIKENPVFGIPAKRIAQQWHGYKKVLSKAPEIAAIDGVLYPPKENLEQSSSELSCRAKQEIFGALKISALTDLTGGWGIDAYYLSQHFGYRHIEWNKELQEMAAHNFQLANCKIESLSANGLEWLSKNKIEGWVYADPQRRDGDNNRSFLMENHLPNPDLIVQQILDSELPGGIIKLSPMVDIDFILSQSIGRYHNAVVVIEVIPEVKELLWIISREQIPFKTACVVVGKDEDLVFIKDTQFLTKETAPADAAKKSHLFIARKGIRKTKFSDLLAAQKGFLPLDKNGNVFWSDSAKDLLEFRCFKILEELPANEKKLNRRFKASTLHVISFHPKIKASTFSAKLRLVPKGQDYLIFCEEAGGTKAYLVALQFISS